MSQAENRELALKAWQGVAEGDVQALREVWDPAIVWHAAGSHPSATRIEGIEAVLDHIAEIGESTDRFDAQLDEFLTSDRRIVYFFRARIRRGERMADIDYVMTARHERGRMTHIWLVPTDPEALAALWGDPRSWLPSRDPARRPAAGHLALGLASQEDRSWQKNTGPDATGCCWLRSSSSGSCWH